jgi:transglutaminase-like putative cysteine protease
VFTGEGEVTIAYEATVEVLAREASLKGVPASAVRDLTAEAIRYLWPSRYCPSDRFADFVCTEFPDGDGGDKVEAILAWIKDHLTYRPGVSDASTTALDTFVDRAGVCRDFTHLAISLIRAANIPARAVAAYAWRLDPPDMHAVVEVYLGGRWRLVDPTGLAPIDGLVRVAWGMDAADIAFMTVFGATTMLAQSFTVDEAQQAAPQAA